MIRGKENLIEWVKSTPGIKQVQIRTAPSADAFLFQSEEGENKKTIEDRLSRTLDYLEPGKYYIEMSDGNSRRNWYRDYFTLEGDAVSSPAFSGPSIGGVSPDEVDRRIAAALDAQKKEFRIAELEERVKEYEEELEERETPLQAAIGRITPYLPAILERFFGKPGMQVGVAGTSQPIRVPEPQPQPQPHDDDHTRILRIAERLAAIEPNYLELLEKLCDKLEENPALLGMIKQFA